MSTSLLYFGVLLVCERFWFTLISSQKIPKYLLCSTKSLSKRVTSMILIQIWTLYRPLQALLVHLITFLESHYSVNFILNPYSGQELYQKSKRVKEESNLLPISGSYPKERSRTSLAKHSEKRENFLGLFGQLVMSPSIDSLSISITIIKSWNNIIKRYFSINWYLPN